MNASDFQKQAMRTKCDQEAAAMRLASARMAQINHSLIGLMGELGEMATMWQKLVYYGKDLNWDEFTSYMAKEYGDSMWYIAEGLDAIDKDLGDVLRGIVEKLKARYPEKWSAEKADHANRNLTAENIAFDKALKEMAAKQMTHPDTAPRHQDDHGFGHMDKGEMDNDEHPGEENIQ